MLADTAALMNADVSFGSVCYPFRLRTDGLPQLLDDLLDMSASRYLVVCDENVAPLVGAEIQAGLSERAPATLLTHPAGEPGKQLEAAGQLIEAALAGGADRASIVVAVGGGITGNIAGLVAALLFRGIRLVHVPTSLMAVLDSVISLKQAVNASVGKNLVGTFYPPSAVLADTALLRSLPRREVVSGMCEAVKNALAIEPEMTHLLLRRLRPDGRYDDATLRLIIAESVVAKVELMRDDERECREGIVLEYGHTVGHAIEHTARGGLSHGEAVAIGMVAAAKVAHRLGHIDAALLELHRELLRRAGAPITIPAGIDLDEVMRRLRFDNKRGYIRDIGDDAAMVLLRGQGKPIWHGDRPLVPVPLALVGEVLDELSDAAAAPAAKPYLAASGSHSDG
jgi:3-dehydroquinate synthase/2-deoxy-scyllo-inosose synthase